MSRKLKGVSIKERIGKEKAEEAKRKMIEGLTGMDYDEYLDTLSEKQKYHKKARHMSKKRNLSKLENHDKSGYELDHTYPVSKGFYSDVSLDSISSLDNLQYLPPKQNRKKSDSIPDKIPQIVKEEIKNEVQ